MSMVVPAKACGVLTSTCGACRRAYSSPRQLKLHRRRIPLCAEWLGMPTVTRDGRCARVCSSAAAADDADGAAKPLEPEPPNAAGVPQFAADGGAPAGAVAAAFEGSRAFPAFWPIDFASADAKAATIPFAGFVAPAYSLCHIIWNVFVIDKEFTRLPNFSEIVAENRVSWVVAILPDAALYESLGPAGIDHGVIEYSGHDVDQPFDAASYDAQCAEIEAHRRRRGNVFVFCNNGYQRSLPFLVYYLTRFHADEVPTVERAIDIILPQVDKANYAARRGDVIRDCERALRTARATVNA